MVQVSLLYVTMMQFLNCLEDHISFQVLVGGDLCYGFMVFNFSPEGEPDCCWNYSSYYMVQDIYTVHQGICDGGRLGIKVYVPKFNSRLDKRFYNNIPATRYTMF